MSRFVSAGTTEDPPERDDDWLRAQQELDDSSRRRKEEANGLQDGGKSLYEVLQANKAAKQEQFEESIRLKNQFRSLDEDEVDFLDSVLESTRAKDEAVRKETTEQLDAFRRQQEEAEKAARAEENGNTAVDDVEEQWTVSGRKRKKTKEKDSFKGFKLRKTSSSSSAPKTTTLKNPLPESPPKADSKSPSSATVAPSVDLPADNSEQPSELPKSSPTPKSPVAVGLGLADYSSDDDN